MALFSELTFRPDLVIIRSLNATEALISPQRCSSMSLLRTLPVGIT